MEPEYTEKSHPLRGFRIGFCFCFPKSLAQKGHQDKNFGSVLVYDVYDRAVDFGWLKALTAMANLL